MEAEGRDQPNRDVEHLIATSPWPEDARSLIDDLGITDERRARAAAMLAGASRSMSKAVRRDPSLLGVLDPPADFAAEKISLTAPDDDDALDGLRRWKRRQLLRIALRDLLGEADLATVGRELSLLADACFVRALEIADEGPPLAIIGMGKLGGNESELRQRCRHRLRPRGRLHRSRPSSPESAGHPDRIHPRGAGVQGGHRVAARRRRWSA